MTASQSTALMRWKMRSRRMPALLTTQSIRPKLSIDVLMIRSAPCGSATLSPLATAAPPALRISATTSSATLVSAPSPSAEPPRSLTTTLPPSLAASVAISLPMPRPAPVTTTTLPSRHPPRAIHVLPVHSCFAMTVALAVCNVNLLSDCQTSTPCAQYTRYEDGVGLVRLTLRNRDDPGNCQVRAH